MKLGTLAATFMLAFAAMLQTAAADPIELQWWHAMTAVNGERINKIAADFNAMQSDYKVTPVFKGSYAETMTGAIAAYRAGSAPAIVQIFEVGTATMMAAKGAIKPVYQLMADAGEKFDPAAYLPSITAYYSTLDGKMLSMPFNSSTPVVYWNKDAFKKAGLDPEKPPKTWPETFDAAKKLRAAGLACGFTSAWISWVQIENFSAWHNLPLGTKANGLEGPDAVLEFNNPTVTRHIANLAAAEKDKSFDYAGRTTEPTAKFISGDCGMLQDSSASYGTVKAGVKFPFGVTMLPYYPDVAGAPQNSIIGGASLWVMAGKKPEEYKGVAKFFNYLSGTPVQEAWHEATGYLPITQAAYQATKVSGYYEKNPGTEVAILQMTGKPPTDNSRGLRFGNLVQIRDVIAEDLEAAFAGKSTPKAALDDAVTRGNAILRQFQKNTQ
ncbi:MAG TPA: sn-glycerol-3-phosphate ABC transporter substrate-binding protein UgpB [Stellaceae bacterium]|jgi:sn-glycerol 3-phosphate transport system substrate-binding protein|nr:sn-glycerol-3-phosphate ABC transporter substrate-binding protein UgpB [Stellaceae bacterium]